MSGTGVEQRRDPVPLGDRCADPAAVETERLGELLLDGLAQAEPGDLEHEPGDQPAERQRVVARRRRSGASSAPAASSSVRASWSSRSSACRDDPTDAVQPGLVAQQQAQGHVLLVDRAERRPVGGQGSS
jgi:hypothetical protein